MLGRVCGKGGGSSRGGGAASSSRGDGECECDAKAFLNAEGCYDIEKLKESDSTWYEHIITGNGWELLDAKMDEEEPDASLDISVALNKRNEAAMSTGHTEIFRALVELCKPDPRPAVAGGRKSSTRFGSG